MSSEEVRRAKRRKQYIPNARYKCPHCGWIYNPSSHDGGFALVPDHLADSYDRLMSCDGAGQTPRNAASDNRPLWKDE